VAGNEEPDRPVLAGDAPGIDDLLKQLRRRVDSHRAPLEFGVGVLCCGVGFVSFGWAHPIDGKPGWTGPSRVYIAAAT